MTKKLQRSAIEPKNPLLNASRNSNLPHVPGIRVGDYIFLSGMVPVDPLTGERSHGPIADQVRVTLSNMRHMLESAGSSLERVLRVHVVLADISHMAEMDRVYHEFFPVDPPARTAWSLQLRFGNAAGSSAWGWQAEASQPLLQYTPLLRFRRLASVRGVASDRDAPDIEPGACTLERKRHGHRPAHVRARKDARRVMA